MVRRQLVAFETGINFPWQVANILREPRKKHLEHVGNLWYDGMVDSYLVQK